jgi:hypothetical protein
MSGKKFDLTGKIALLESSVVEVYPSENKAVLSVPNRGTIQTNTAIAYCWLKQYEVLSPISINSSDDAVILIFRLDAAPFAKTPKDETDELAALRLANRINSKYAPNALSVDEGRLWCYYFELLNGSIEAKKLVNILRRCASAFIAGVRSEDHEDLIS